MVKMTHTIPAQMLDNQLPVLPELHLFAFLHFLVMHLLHAAELLLTPQKICGKNRTILGFDCQNNLSNNKYSVYHGRINATYRSNIVQNRINIGYYIDNLKHDKPWRSMLAWCSW